MSGAPPRPEVYWMPGCTSCLRVKEFMERSGVDYEPVDLAAHPERGEKLTRLGLVVPAVTVGERGVHGLDLVSIAKLIGIDYEAPATLAPSVLAARYRAIVAALGRIVGHASAGQLDIKPPDRDRTVRYLAAHAGTIMRKFVEAYELESFDNFAKPPANLAEHGDVADLVAWASGTSAMFDRWWDTSGRYDELDRVLETTWGYRTLHEVMERAVWHTAQHTRQLEFFLSELSPTPVPDGLNPDDLRGLPLPERVHA